MDSNERTIFGRTYIIVKTLTSVITSLIFLSLSGCTKEGPVGPEGPPGGEDLTNPNVQPKVLFTYPSNNAIGPFGIYNRGDGYSKPHFTVRFNKLMSKFSVLPGTVTCQGFGRPVIVVLYQPYGGGCCPSNSGSKASSDDFYSDVLSFSVIDSLGYYYYPRMLYRVGQTYTVTIDSTLEDINGNHLGQRFTFSDRKSVV